MSEQELIHYGVKGMKWGARRYRNPDGTLTQKGRKRQEKEDRKWVKKNATAKNYNNVVSKSYDEFQKRLPEFNKTMKFTGSKKNRESNDRRYTKFMNEILSRSMRDVIRETSSPSGRYRLDIILDTIGGTPMMVVVDNET